MTNRLYKFLGLAGTSCNGGAYIWSLPRQQKDGSWKPGEWTPKITDLSPCKSGYHCCRGEHLKNWLNARLFECEIDGASITENDKIVASRMRLIREITTWNGCTMVLWVYDCVNRVLSEYEKMHPDDDRPRAALKVTKRWLDGERVSADELHYVAKAAAWASVEAAAWAARAAAWTARAAAWTVWAATDAARTAARAAVWAAEAAGAVKETEAAWQNRRLLEVIGEAR